MDPQRTGRLDGMPGSLARAHAGGTTQYRNLPPRRQAIRHLPQAAAVGFTVPPANFWRRHHDPHSLRQPERGPRPHADRRRSSPPPASGGPPGWRPTAGGKGLNVARALGRLDRLAYVAGLLGGRTGDLVAASAEAAGISASWTRIRGETRTCIILVDDRGGSTVVNEPGPTIDADDWHRFRRRRRPIGVRCRRCRDQRQPAARSPCRRHPKPDRIVGDGGCSGLGRQQRRRLVRCDRRRRLRHQSQRRRGRGRVRRYRRLRHRRPRRRPQHADEGRAAGGDHPRLGGSRPPRRCRRLERRGAAGRCV